MIAGKDVFEVISAITPLYFSLLLGFSSVRLFRIFSAEQCSGINRFVALFAIPLLSFHFISTNNPFAMNLRFLAADSLQKFAILAALSLYHRLFSRSLDWTITLFSLATLPNTLVMGIPLLRAMYGDFSAPLMVQIVVLQSVLWYTLMIFFLEYRAAKALIADQFPPEVSGSIASFCVESDIISLASSAPLCAEADVVADGRLRVVVRRDRGRSISDNGIADNNNNNWMSVMTSRASDLSGVEIYSIRSSRERTPRGPSFDQSDLNLNFGGKGDWNNGGEGKELRIHVWSAPSGSAAWEGDFRNAVNRGASADFGGMDLSSNNKSAPIALPDFPSSNAGLPILPIENASPTRKGEYIDIEDGLNRSPAGSKFPANNGSPFLGQKKVGNEGGGGGLEKKVEGNNNQRMPPTTVMSRLILIMVWRKLIRNPNTYSSLIGLVWSFISFRWNIEMPAIIKGSIAILSDAGMGMAMFSLGLFMALQPKIIACGKSVAALSMAVRFLAGPAVIAATSTAIGIRGVLLQVTIVQAALPQGIVPFVFAKEYNCHPDILSTAVIFGMLIALPITILYYVILGSII